MYKNITFSSLILRLLLGVSSPVIEVGLLDGVPGSTLGIPPKNIELKS